MKLLLLRR